MQGRGKYPMSPRHLNRDGPEFARRVARLGARYVRRRLGRDVLKPELAPCSRNSTRSQCMTVCASTPELRPQESPKGSSYALWSQGPLDNCP